MVLVGEPFWVRLPETEEALRGSHATSVDDFATLPALVQSFRDHGWDLVQMVLADPDDWDHYAAAQWLTTRRWLDANPRDELWEQMRADLDAAPWPTSPTPEPTWAGESSPWCGDDGAVIIRERREEDLPRLAEVLAEQQAASQYPIRWPLPIPLQDFLVRPAEERAWVATDDAEDVHGHVAVHSLGDDDVSDAFRAALGSDDLAVVAVLFTSAGSRGTGVGAALFDTAVAWILETDRTPVLDVVPTHDVAVTFYRRRGWVEVGVHRPPWLGADLALMVHPARADA